jgi:hypothetical protein
MVMLGLVFFEIFNIRFPNKRIFEFFFPLPGIPIGREAATRSLDGFAWRSIVVFLKSEPDPGRRRLIFLPVSSEEARAVFLHGFAVYPLKRGVLCVPAI